MVWPKVSICIPTFNGEDYIAEALESAINQTYKNLEIIVSDDASLDSTLQIIEAYKTKTDTPILIFKHKPNGIGSNWNNCIKNASGEYIKFLFQDDKLKLNCVERMMDIIHKDNSIGIVTCQREFLFDPAYKTEKLESWIENFGKLQKGLKLKDRYYYKVMDQSFLKSKHFLKSPLNKIGEPTAVLFKKSIVNNIGYFREDLKQILDYEFYYRALKQYNIAILPESLIYFRLHAKQTSVYNSKHYDYDEDDFSKILYNDYMDYVDEYTKVHLRKKYNIFYKVYYYLKSRF